LFQEALFQEALLDTHARPQTLAARLPPGARAACGCFKKKQP
jgi:hypothetical protein